MQTAKQIATHLRAVYFGGNWTFSNLKEHLSDLSWQQATQQVHSLNTIATLVFHIGYYINVATKVLEDGPLDGNDKFSFQHPPIESQEDWEQFLAKTWAEAEHFANLVEQLPDEKLLEVFSEEKYGNYYRNMHGIIEHAHYHLGQIVLIKKMILQEEK
jgi:uncharacterized damage-inducible protein DinB